MSLYIYIRILRIIFDIWKKKYEEEESHIYEPDSIQCIVKSNAAQLLHFIRILIRTLRMCSIWTRHLLNRDSYSYQIRERYTWSNIVLFSLPLLACSPHSSFMIQLFLKGILQDQWVRNKRGSKTVSGGKKKGWRPISRARPVWNPIALSASLLFRVKNVGLVYLVHLEVVSLFKAEEST